MLRIVEYPHPALLHSTVPVQHIDKDLRLRVGEMFEKMYDARGVGLAANQVALPYRLVVMNLDTESKSAESERIYVNPTIIARRGSVEDEEGCLSFPGLYVKIRRAKEVTVEAFDMAGEKVRVVAQGLEARAWQHEIEHLDGKVFLDRFSTLSKLAHRSEIKDFERRFRRAQEEGRLPSSVDIERSLALLREQMARQE